jgi:hypothetical protein
MPTNHAHPTNEFELIMPDIASHCWAKNTKSEITIQMNNHICWTFSGIIMGPKGNNNEPRLFKAFFMSFSTKGRTGHPECIEGETGITETSRGGPL